MSSFPPSEPTSSANKPLPKSPPSTRSRYPTGPTTISSGVTNTVDTASSNPHGHAIAQFAPDAPSIRSCVTCRRRKVRCNKRTPCSNCAKAGIECIFPPPGRAPRKTKRPHDAELLSRLRRLEGVIEHLSGQKTAPAESQSSVSSPLQQEHGAVEAKKGAETSPQMQSEEAGLCPFMLDPDPKAAKPRTLEHEFGRLVIDEGRSRYVSNRFWASLGDEIEELQDILDPSSSEEEDYPSPESSSTLSTNHDGFLFGFYSLSHSLRSYHPPPCKVPLIWDIYQDNVAPLIPLFHKPTVQQLLMSAAQSPNLLDKNSEALVLSIYLVTVVSMSPEQCLSTLGEDRDTAVTRYRFAVEQALSKANLLNTQNLMLLQAAVLFLIGVRREDDTKFVWSMTAIVLRLAQGLGLHRDGTNFGLRPFETEMRRRLWWHICLLDIRSAEDHGTDAQVHEIMYDTHLPLNINDEDLTPGMLEPPEERVGFTEMTFCLVRCEITAALRRVSYMCPGGQDRSENAQRPSDACGKLIQEVNKRVEERYTRHCDMNVPVQWVCATVARLILAKLWLIVHHPMTRINPGASNLTMASRENLFVTSVEVAEFTRLLGQNKNTSKWSWLFVTNLQWHLIAFVLSELCVRPINPITDRAWLVVSSLYETWGRTAKHQKGMLWRPLSRLMKRAAAFRAKQQAGVQISPSISSPSIPLPPYHGPAWQSMSQPHLAAQVQGAGTSSTQPANPPSTGAHFDTETFSEFLPSVNWLSGSSSQTMPTQEPFSATSSSGISASFLPSSSTSQDPALLDHNWAAWDQIMRDFQMDVQEAQTNHPLGNISDWFA
ncbi:putative C6 transcription factor [Aspergillus clavatus NRRL 1]|uniref:C6 transcription factor, putative n=1 Tax=Aspergillus clavatus (strain ATCC 1007 / CBS 513.65 / DSM 816 / NCTC 3887 / NRRL 1 / QM 1276 / 107) TaxID=344612 RepID=A1CRS3_ASPCL|nr:C6 transcription factor, putative [Aspergillus clavatus NRRL 1]EAW08344.1 C6 transcription factor, putative [Aspergillus clavatus NRRL 1]